MSDLTIPQTSEIVVAGVTLLQDEQGRYSLSALHLASGAKPHKRPQFWLEKTSTQELINELDTEFKRDLGKSSLDVVVGGNAPGTYVNELLAISYAGWVSPKFQLRVNQVFLNHIRAERLHPVRERLPQLVDIMLQPHGYRISYAPVCWRCDTPVTPFDMREELCQRYKVCANCVTEVRRVAPAKDRKSGRWSDVLESDISKMYGPRTLESKTHGSWKSALDVPTLCEVIPPQIHELVSVSQRLLA